MGVQDCRVPGTKTECLARLHRAKKRLEMKTSTHARLIARGLMRSQIQQILWARSALRRKRISLTRSRLAVGPQRVLTTWSWCFCCPSTRQHVKCSAQRRLALHHVGIIPHVHVHVHVHVRTWRSHVCMPARGCWENPPLLPDLQPMNPDNLTVDAVKVGVVPL